MPITHEPSPAALTPSVVMMRYRNDHPPTVDTEGDFAVGDYVSFEYHGTMVTGYIAEFERDSYLFVANRQPRPFARVVPDFDKRHLRPYGWCVLIGKLIKSLP